MADARRLKALSMVPPLADEVARQINEVSDGGQGTREIAEEALETANEAEAIARAAKIAYPDTADAAVEITTPDPIVAKIVGDLASDYVPVDAEPTHTEKFQDATGQWWSKQNTHAVNILEFGAYPGPDVDSTALLSRALLFLLQSQDNKGQSLDLCGLEWGITSGLQMPRYVEIRNGSLKALGDRALWGDDYMVKTRTGHGNWRMHNVTLNAGSIANGVRINSSAEATFCTVRGYKNYGWHYAGGGCQMLFCSASKDDPSRDVDRTNKDFLSEGWGLYANNPDGKFTNIVVRGRLGVGSGGHHLLFTNIHCFMGTPVSETIMGSDLISEQWTAPWTLASVDDHFVRKNGVTQTPGVDYTIVLDGSGFPTFTFPGALSSDTFFIKVRLQHVSAWEIRGGSNTFQGCYFDNGYVDIYSMNQNNFQGVMLYNNQNVFLDSQVRLWATSVDERLGYITWDVGPSTNLPTFKLMAEPGANWIAGAERVVSEQIAEFGKHPRMFINGENTGVVATFASSNNGNNSSIRFSDPSTTNVQSIGSAGNSVEIRSNNIVRQTLSANGAITFPSTTTFLVQNGTGDSFRIKPDGTFNAPQLATYADNAAALSGGLVAGDIYKTATGELRIVV